jgi:hypothetical protein
VVKTFRIPAELIKALEEMGAYSVTDAIVQLLDQALAVRETLGEEQWAEVRARAAREELYEGRALGKVLGELARETLGSKGRKR